MREIKKIYKKLLNFQTYENLLVGFLRFLVISPFLFFKQKKYKSLFQKETYENAFIKTLKFLINKSPLKLVNKKYALHHPYQATSTSIATILLIFGTVSWFLITSYGLRANAWWNDSWTYRKAIPLTNNTTEETDIYVSVTVDTSDTAKFQVDCDDLRFTKANGELLPYYIESGCGTASTEVLVGLDVFPADGQSIYMYYGNATAENRERSPELEGSVTQANMRMSVVDGTAFVDFSAQNTLINHLSNRLKITDSAGKELLGFIKAVGTGETYGSELLLNTGFDTNLDNWTAINGASQELDAGGRSGNAIKVILPAVLSANSYQSFSVTSGALYASSAYAKQGTDSWQTLALYEWRDDYTPYGSDGKNSADWESRATHAVAATTDTVLAISLAPYFSPATAGKYALFDDTSVKQILTPSTTGVTITSTSGGSTYNWASEESGFERNDSSDYTYVIYATEFTTEASNYTVGSLGSEEVGPGPVGYWSFDEGYGTTAHDESGQGNDGVITGATWTDESQCISGKCLYFNGDGHTTISNSSELQVESEISVSVWFKWLGASGDYQHRLVVKDNSNKDYFMWIYGSAHTNPDKADRVCFGINGQSSDNFYVCSDDSVNDGEWHHAVGRYDNSLGSDTLVLYLDGFLQDETEDITNSLNANLGDLLLSSSVATTDFNGYIDEVKIYPYPRSADQIKQDYNAGLAGVKAASGTAVSIGDSSDKWMSDGLVGYWKMDESSWSGTAGEVLDYSGNNNHLTAAGDATTTAGKYGSGGTFDGADDVVTITDAELSDNFPGKSGYNADQMTVSFWIYYDTAVSGRAFRKPSIVQLSGNTFGLRTSSGSGYFNFSGLTTGTWQHLVMVYDGEYMRGYLNGENGGTSVALSGTIDNNTEEFDIGAGGYPTIEYEIDGQIDEFRVYNRALSANEVNQLYKWAPGPVMHLKMDEKVAGDAQTIYDISGNENHGTTEWGTNASGMDCTVSGKYGSACEFDGDDYINIGDPSDGILDFGLNSFSFMAWVNTSDINSFAVSKRNLDEGYEILVGRGGVAGTLGIRLGDGSTDLYGENWENNNDGDWHFIAGVVDREAQTLTTYGDGVVIGNATSISGFGSVSTDWGLAIGARGALNSYMEGGIDDVRIYNYARTSDQIIEDMNAGHPAGGSPVGSPVAYWKFDEGFGDTTYDELGNSDGTLDAGSSGDNTSSSSMWTKNGRINGAMEFDGEDDWVNLGDGSSLELASFSVSFWFNKVDGSTRQIVSKVDSIANEGWELGIESDEIVIKLDDDDAKRATTPFSGGDVNTWIHVLGTYDGDNLKLYRDGVLADTVTGITDYTTSSAVVALGRRGAGTILYYSGLIDEVKIWNYALSEDEIKTEYNFGKATVMGEDASRNNDGTTVTGANKDYCIPGDTAQCDAPVGEWKFDEKSGTTAFDKSGNGNDGTISGASWERGKFGGALSFNGSSDYVSVADPGTSSLDITGDNITINAWIFPKELSPADIGYVVSKGDLGGADPQNYQLYQDHSGGGVLECDFYNGGWNTHTTSTNVIAANQWQHVSFVKDAADLIVYVNGIEVLREAETDDMLANDNNLWIGGDSTDQYFNGLIDQVQIFDYSRTPAQIAWDYNRGKPIAHWKFDEGEGTTAHDESGNANNGELDYMEPATDWVSGKTNGGLEFDGSSDYLPMANESNFDFERTDPFSFAGWFKADSADTSIQIPISKSSDYSPFSGLHFVTNYNCNSNDAGKIMFALANDWSSSAICVSSSSDTNLGDDNWHHYAVTYDGSSSASGASIYEDGVAIALTAVRDTLNATTLNNIAFSVGGRGDGAPQYGELFNGVMDEVRVYNYELTETQVKSLYNGGAVSFR